MHTSNPALKLFANRTEKSKDPNPSRGNSCPTRQRTCGNVWTNCRDCSAASPNLDGEIGCNQQREYLFDCCMGSPTLRSGEGPEGAEIYEQLVAGRANVNAGRSDLEFEIRFYG